MLFVARGFQHRVGGYALCIGALLCAVFSNSGCTLKRKTSSLEPDFQQITEHPLPPEQAKAMVKEVGNNWLYGDGMGNTAIAVGSTIAFPPLGLWWLGNAALSLAGYEPLRVADALPKQEGDAWRHAYDSVAGAPGRVAAAIAGKEFRSEELAKERLKSYFPAVPAPQLENEKHAALP